VSSPSAWTAQRSLAVVAGTALHSRPAGFRGNCQVTVAVYSEAAWPTTSISSGRVGSILLDTSGHRSIRDELSVE
jgi:hypothetical protein